MNRFMRNRRLLLLLLLLELPVVAQAGFTYTTDNGTITITGYTGPGGAVSIPSAINGLPVTGIGSGAFTYFTTFTSVTIPSSVTRIGDRAFYGCSSLASVTIPGSVTSIGVKAFLFCNSLRGVYFEGSAPPDLDSLFLDTDNMTVYYLPGTTGWGPEFGERPTALWKPQVQASDASFGVRTNQFGFNISWASGRVVVVEASTGLAHPVWSPVGTNSLTDGSSYFSDPQWTNYPGRFYRLRSP